MIRSFRFEDLGPYSTVAYSAPGGVLIADQQYRGYGASLGAVTLPFDSKEHLRAMRWHIADPSLVSPEDEKLATDVVRRGRLSADELDNLLQQVAESWSKIAD